MGCAGQIGQEFFDGQDRLPQALLMGPARGTLRFEVMVTVREPAQPDRRRKWVGVHLCPVAQWITLSLADQGRGAQLPQVLHPQPLGAAGRGG
jgi:hypothetical protein